MDILEAYLAIKTTKELWYGESIDCISFANNTIYHNLKRCKNRFCNDLLTHILITLNASFGCRFRRQYNKEKKLEEIIIV